MFDEQLAEALLEFLAICAIFGLPGWVWLRLVTGSWNIVNPDLGDRH
jgi:hypothetical protein